ncbi:MAG: Lrp/AsnC family transcriptional regulator [Inquilinus sp.]|nr:Lrp/AsnC family transcriptional regulator [Inquilinus sp.]
MALNDKDRRLLHALQDGLPLVPRPYAAVAEAVGLSEADVVARLARLADEGVVKRFGVVVRHRELGYRANAMTVWDVPDEAVAATGRRLAELDFVTLCYRRPRRLPDWPYNLFAMIHGRDRASVLRLVEQATEVAGLAGHPRAILFSRRGFKQRGARYLGQPARPEPALAG